MDDHTLHWWASVMHTAEVSSLVVTAIAAVCLCTSVWLAKKFAHEIHERESVAFAKYKVDAGVLIEDAKKEGVRAGKSAGDAMLRAAELEKEAALAKERTTVLEKGVADANARADEAQLALERFKAPRTIANAEKPKMIAALTGPSPVKAAVYILGDGPEPNGLGASILDVLVRARWDALRWNWSGVGGIVGVVIFTKAGSSGAVNDAANALLSALRAAHIDSVGQPWPGDWDKFGGMLNGPNPPAPTEAPIRIVVGAKPQ